MGKEEFLKYREAFRERRRIGLIKRRDAEDIELLLARVHHQPPSLSRTPGMLCVYGFALYALSCKGFIEPLIDYFSR